MILFCDTSALVKLYVKEDGSDELSARVAAYEAVAVCRITWVEMMSALARRAREQSGQAPTLAQARARMAADWPALMKVEVSQPLIEVAGDCADAFALRAYDSVQLAAVQTLHRALPNEVRFACADQRLLKAAKLLGIESA